MDTLHPNAASTVVGVLTEMTLFCTYESCKKSGSLSGVGATDEQHQYLEGVGEVSLSMQLFTACISRKLVTASSQVNSW